MRVTEAPLLSSTANPFVRTVAPVGGNIVVLTTSGLTVLPSGYDAAVAPPAISAVVSAADGSSAVAPGGLISIYGSNMAATNMATSTLPLPTAMAPILPGDQRQSDAAGVRFPVADQRATARRSGRAATLPSTRRAASAAISISPVDSHRAQRVPVGQRGTGHRPGHDRARRRRPVGDAHQSGPCR